MSLRKSDLAEAISSADNETFTIGESVFIRTVSFSTTGKIKRISQLGSIHFLHLIDAAMIADTERWTDCIEHGRLREVEPVSSEVRISSRAIVDVWRWNKPLPRTQK